MRVAIEYANARHIGDLRDLSQEGFMSGGRSHGCEELPAGAACGNSRRRRGEGGGQARYLSDAAAGQKRHDRRERIEPECPPRLLTIDAQRNLIRERMSDKFCPHAVPAVELGLEWQEAQHEVARGSDGAHPALAPCPHLATDVLRGPN